MVNNKDWIREVELSDTPTILKETLHGFQLQDKRKIQSW